VPFSARALSVGLLRGGLLFTPVALGAGAYYGTEYTFDHMSYIVLICISAAVSLRAALEPELRSAVPVATQPWSSKALAGAAAGSCVSIPMLLLRVSGFSSPSGALGFIAACAIGGSVMPTAEVFMQSA
jgi:hypothetical protein